MPKDNEVSNLDNAITKARSEVDFALCRGPRAMEAREKRLSQIVCLLELAKHDHAATVAELRAEIEDRRVRHERTERDACMWASRAEAATKRADAAERRVGELEAELTKLRDEWQASLGWKGAVVHGTRANIGVIADALTGADPT